MKTAFQKAYEQAINIDPTQAAKNCGFDFYGSKDSGYFTFNFLSREVRLEFPRFTGIFQDNNQEIDKFFITSMMYYLSTSDGRNLTNNWVSYAGLPGGQQYVSAMRNYTGNLLVKSFVNDTESLRRAAESLGAVTSDIAGDLSLKFQLFPKAPLALVYWKGDDEFEPRADFLFDESAPHHLPSDCYAVLCSWLTGQLLSRFQGK